LVSSGSMNDYIDKAVKRYSSLFTLPRHSRILFLLFAVCILSGIVMATMLRFLFYNDLIVGSGLGIALFILITATDLTIHFTSFQEDLIFNLRRCSALSLYSATFWLAFILLGVMGDTLGVEIWLKLFFVGFCVVLALRFLVLWTISFANIGKVSFYAALMPVTYAIPVIFAASLAETKVLDVSTVLFLALSLVITLSAVLFFLYSLNRVGVKLLGVGSFSILKAFLASWTEDLNEPFERFFERFGVERDIKVSALAFRSNDRIKALMVVPAFHPGPFKNVGSSNLPHQIQTMLENKLLNCIAAVPHGLSGHDLDLASQAQNQLVLNSVEKMTDFSDYDSVASSLVRVKRNGASVSCQLFGNCAFVTLTLAPETMEDLPPNLDSFIFNEAEKRGISAVINVDAHNSIEGPFKIDAAIKPLQEAVETCLKKVAALESKDFEVGIAKVVPPEFGLREGMGPGGIVVTVIRVSGQTSAYVTLDGNNIVSGLREQILSALAEIGVDDGEVFTTDTHVVNAVVLTARGYHPIGEVMDHETLIKHIKKAASNAIKNLEPAEVSWRTERIANVKIIGEKQIETMCMLVDKTVQKAKKLAISLFPLAGVVLTALLMLLK
jgi:putative membrane protein